MRQFFKTSKVHTCYSQETGQPKPKKCKCRKMVSKSVAIDLVRDGIAQWEIDYSGEVPIPSWNIVMYGRVMKTPRSKTIEQADMERYTEGIYYPAYLYNPEVMELFEAYHDIEMEERIKLFKDIGQDLIHLKKTSDSLGIIEGGNAKQAVDMLIESADVMKSNVAVDDPFVGRAIFNPIGTDQRTSGGIGKFVNKKLDKIEEF